MTTKKYKRYFLPFATFIISYYFITILEWHKKGMSYLAAYSWKKEKITPMNYELIKYLKKVRHSLSNRVGTDTRCLIVKWDIIDSEKRQKTNTFLFQNALIFIVYDPLRGSVNCNYSLVFWNFMLWVEIQNLKILWVNL